ncbi:hypothetical protein [Ancylobacter sp. IITR112]|uniref:hypothetical protein n=1 Tax=Ancylobacter sp. IITR112 TaxID=3138073 RepID=UPI00352B9DAF
MTFLIFDTVAAAQARSEQAWLDCGYLPDSTTSLWSWVPHPLDGRAALTIPTTPLEAQIGLSQEAYDALLTEAEKAMLVDVLPDEWIPEEYY